jgi:hypothetical protein
MTLQVVLTKRDGLYSRALLDLPGDKKTRLVVMFTGNQADSGSCLYIGRSILQPQQ